jgi:hypothetical protein
MRSYSQSEIIDALHQAKEKMPGAFAIEHDIDSKGICNFLAIFEGYYLATDRYSEITTLYDTLFSAEKNGFKDEDQAQLARSFAFFCLAYNNYQVFIKKEGHTS